MREDNISGERQFAATPLEETKLHPPASFLGFEKVGQSQIAPNVCFKTFMFALAAYFDSAIVITTAEALVRKGG